MATEAGTAGVLKDTKERNVICMKKKEWILLSLPVISILVTGAVDVLVKRSLQQMKMPQPYLLYFLGLCLVVYLAFGAASLFSVQTRKQVVYMAPFYAMLAQLLDGLNLATAKFALLPVIYKEVIYEVAFLNEYESSGIALDEEDRAVWQAYRDRVKEVGLGALDGESGKFKYPGKSERVLAIEALKEKDETKGQEALKRHFMLINEILEERENRKI